MDEKKTGLLSRGYLHATSIVFLTLLLVISLLSEVKAQTAPIPSHEEIYILSSGIHEGTAGETELTFSHLLRIQDAPWLQIHFSSYNLDENSYIILTAEKDGAKGVFYSRHLLEQNDYSAYFNGGEVKIELYVAPGQSGIYFEIDKVIVGDWVGKTDGQELIVSICGPNDDRVSSDDPAVGRIITVGCTGWIVSNEAYLTAGHCAGGDLGTLEFNVPPSLEDGTIQHPGPEHQYTIDQNSVVHHEGQIGNDWCVFDCFANAQTGSFAWQVQGAFYRMSKDDQPNENTVTGFGIDNSPPGPSPPYYLNSDSQTQQTHTGPTSTSYGTVIRYFVDTMPGSSGSPVINPEFLVSLTDGIHTHGGCSSSDPPVSPNNGTRFNNPDLESAIHSFQLDGFADVEYVDGLHPESNEDGSVFRPWDSVAEGATSVSSYGVVCIVKGYYDEQNIVITNPMTIKTTAGPVVIGASGR